MGLLDTLINQQANEALGIANNSVESPMFNVDSESVKKIGNIAADSFFFNWPKLDIKDSFKVFNYQFVIHSGKTGKVVKVLSLPLSPQSISYSVPAAVSTTVTMKGISEEHNGAPLRPIAITGTSGVRPVSGFSNGINAGGSSLLEYAFANTISAAKKIGSNVEKLVNAFSSDANIKTPIAANEEQDLVQDETGYSIIHNMMRFFDWYLDAKKAGNKDLYLCFCMNKDRMFFDVTLNGYNVRKAPGAVDYEYSVNMTAWRRRNANPIGDQLPISKVTGTEQTVNYFAKLSLGLQAATAAVAGIGDLASGIQNDFEANVLGPVKQVGLLIGAFNGSVAKISGFGLGISNALKEAIKKSIKNKGLKDENDQNSKLSKILKDKGINDALGSSSQSAPTSAKKPADSSNPFEKVFNDPGEFSAFFDEISLDQLEIPASVQNLIDDEITKALALTSADIMKIKSNIDSFAAKFSESLGGGDEAYNRLNGRPTPTTIRQLTINDITTLNDFNTLSTVMDQVAFALQQRERQSNDDYYSFYSNYARTNGIDFKENTSKFYIPFPFGASLESLAVQYLGDIDRWIEIAAINSLKSPYVDEEGYFIPMKSSGSGTNTSVTNVDGLYVGQIVVLSSDTQVPEKRKIRSIDIISEIESLIYFDGPADLSRFILIDNPQIKAFAPQTVNSNMIIAMPSDVAVNVPGSIRTNPDDSDLSAIALIAKSDFKLIFSTTGGDADIAFIGNDIATSEGMSNIKQAAYIKLLTNQGDLLHDPSFGNPVRIGDSVAEINAVDVLSRLSKVFADDPRFVGIIASKATLKGGSLAIDLLAGVTGSKSYLPLSVDVPR